MKREADIGFPFLFLCQKENMPRMIAPSVLAANFADLGVDIDMINESKADWFHIDVMDGVFVPNISFGFPVMKAIKARAKKPLDVHLMIVNPDRFIKDFAIAGAEIITVHYEACTHLHRTIEAIKAEGVKAGVSLNPHTPVHLLEDIIADLDLVLIMSVNPGYGGQKFIENSFGKIRKLKALITQKGSKALIEVDGGVNASNAAQLYEAGADVLVAGNAVFSAADPKAEIEKIKGS
jgi:ribulose-phosphate 3-epimerase